jgi:hypothetical protein
MPSRKKRPTHRFFRASGEGARKLPLSGDYRTTDSERNIWLTMFVNGLVTMNSNTDARGWARSFGAILPPDFAEFRNAARFAAGVGSLVSL